MTTPMAAGPGFPRAAPSVFTRYRIRAEYGGARRFDNLPSKRRQSRGESTYSTEDPMSKPTVADAELMLRLYEIRRDPELRKARQWMLSEFKASAWEEIEVQYLSGSEPDRHYR